MKNNALIYFFFIIYIMIYVISLGIYFMLGIIITNIWKCNKNFYINYFYIIKNYYRILYSLLYSQNSLK